MDPKLVNEVSATILNNRNDLLNRINHIESKNEPKPVKEHFKKIKTDFDKSIEALDKLKKKK
jgi:hypothetical protein